jgi:hypothetical protein
MRLNAIVKIHKYGGLHEGHNFIPMAMEVHDTPKHDMDCFIRGNACLFHNRQLKGYLSLSFCIQFVRQCVSIALPHAMAFFIKRKIASVGDAYSRLTIIIRPHNLHTCNIRGVWVR